MILLVALGLPPRSMQRVTSKAMLLPRRGRDDPEDKAGFVWASGYWSWSSATCHVRSRSAAREERRGERWVPHQWTEKDGRYHFTEGHWEPRCGRIKRTAPTLANRRSTTGRLTRSQAMASTFHHCLRAFSRSSGADDHRQVRARREPQALVTLARSIRSGSRRLLSSAATLGRDYAIESQSGSCRRRAARTAEDAAG
jgi:hypothetical protein